MPQHDITCPSNGQPIDRLALAVSAPRGASTSSNPSNGCYCSCACFADDSTPSTYAAGCAACTCFADDDVAPSVSGACGSGCVLCYCFADEA